MLFIFKERWLIKALLPLNKIRNIIFPITYKEIINVLGCAW